MVRDLQYEQLNTIYDKSYDSYRIKCKNYELCKSTLPCDHYQCYSNYLCMSCDIFGWKELEFRENNEECIVCLEINTKQLKFPANCGHWFCVSCSHNILFWDETRYHLSPVPYGCPPCPNGCINPEKGRQCYCEEHEKIQDEWEQKQPDEYEEWNNAENESISIGFSGTENINGSVFGSKKCPLCRKKYE